PITIGWDTFVRYCVDIGSSLARHGFRRILFLNGHGSNIPLVDVAARLIGLEHPTVLAAAAFYLTSPESAKVIAEVRESGIGGMGHACELETSIYLHLDPEAVFMDRAVDENSYPDGPNAWMDWSDGPLKLMPWWNAISHTGVHGEATKATAAKGKVLFEQAVTECVSFIRELRSKPLPVGGEPRRSVERPGVREQDRPSRRARDADARRRETGRSFRRSRACERRGFVVHNQGARSGDPFEGRRIGMRFVSRVAVLFVVGMLVVAVSAAGALGQSSSPSASAGGSGPLTFTYADVSPPSSLNPMVGYLGTDYTIWAMNYDIPINFSTKDFSPDFDHSIVTSVDTSSDGMTFTYHMRSGLKWSDGQPFTANDVAWTLNFYKKYNVPNYSSDLALMDRAEAINDTTFVLHSKQPTSFYSGKSVFLYEYILPEHIWGKYENDYKAAKRVANDNPQE